MAMTKPQALKSSVEEYVVIDRCIFGVINMTMPPFFLPGASDLADDQLDRIDDRGCEQGYKKGVERKSPDRLTGVYRLIFML